MELLTIRMIGGEIEMDGIELIKALIIIARDEMHVSRNEMLNDKSCPHAVKEYDDDVIQLKELIDNMVHGSHKHGTTCQDWDDIGANGKDSIHWLDGYPCM
jgi:hypothetical protein